MADKRRRPVPGGREPIDRLKEETARDLGLDDELQEGADMTTRQAGRIGGQMVKRLVDKGKEELEEEEAQRPGARPPLNPT